MVNAAYLGSKVLTAIAVGATKVWEGVSKYIKFADPVVEQICAQKWGDGIGITLAQAKSVNDLGTTFRNNTEITSFTELPMFGINKISEYAFYYCTNLTELTLFEGITKIEQRALAFAPIKELYIPSTLSYVSGQFAFSSVNPDKLIVGNIDTWLKIKVDGVGDFYNLPNVNSSTILVNGKDEYFDYIVPSDIVEIPADRLRNFPLKSLDMNNVTNIAERALHSSKVENVVMNKVSTIATGGFQNCTFLATIVGVENVTSIADRAFAFCGNLSCPIKINPSVNVIKEYTFISCDKIPYLDFSGHTQVPSLMNVNAMANKPKILVPESLYSDWIAASNWSALASRIVTTISTN